MFQPVVRFLVCSDVHYTDDPTPVREYFEKYVKMGYELAEQDENYKAVDALYIVGDFLNTGTEAQFLAFRDSLNKVVREETKVVPVLAGHEFLHAAGEEECLIERPWDPDSFVYTDERIRTEKAPEFSANADLNVTCTEQKLLVDFPQAIGETEQYTVTLRRAKDQSVVARIVTLSKQIYYRPPQRLTVSFDLLPPGEYLAEVRPRGYFGSQGAILSVSFSVLAK